MRNKDSNYVTTFLSRNNNDELYKNIKRLEPTIKEELRKKVLHYYFNNYSEFRKLLGVLQQYYEPGFTIMDFYINILSILGEDDSKKGYEIFIRTLEDVVKDIIHDLKLDTEEFNNVKNVLLIQILYKSYMGFLTEELIYSILDKEGIFNLETSEDLDYKYKIDLLVSLKEPLYKDYKIGIQFKSESFIKTAPYFKQKYIEGNKEAIKEGIAKEVVYIAHTDYGEPLKSTIGALHSKEMICNNTTISIFGGALEIATDEDILNELIYIVLKMYNIDNCKVPGLEKFIGAKQTERDFEAWKEDILGRKKAYQTIGVVK